MSIFKKLFQPIRNTVVYLWPVLGTVKKERLTLTAGNEMWRIGGGYNNSRPFVRIDWKDVGYRWTWGIDYYQAYIDIYRDLSDKDQIKCQDKLDEIKMTMDRNSPDVVMVTRNHAVVCEPKDLWPAMYNFALQQR